MALSVLAQQELDRIRNDFAKRGEGRVMRRQVDGQFYRQQFDSILGYKINFEVRVGLGEHPFAHSNVRTPDADDLGLLPRIQWVVPFGDPKKGHQVFPK